MRPRGSGRGSGWGHVTVASVALLVRACPKPSSLAISSRRANGKRAIQWRKYTRRSCSCQMLPRIPELLTAGGGTDVVGAQQCCAPTWARAVCGTGATDEAGRRPGGQTAWELGLGITIRLSASIRCRIPKSLRSRSPESCKPALDPPFPLRPAQRRQVAHPWADSPRGRGKLARSGSSGFRLKWSLPKLTIGKPLMEEKQTIGTCQGHSISSMMPPIQAKAPRELESWRW